MWTNYPCASQGHEHFREKSFRGQGSGNASGFLGNDAKGLLFLCTSHRGSAEGRKSLSFVDELNDKRVWTKKALSPVLEKEHFFYCAHLSVKYFWAYKPNMFILTYFRVFMFTIKSYFIYLKTLKDTLKYRFLKVEIKMK